MLESNRRGTLVLYFIMAIAILTVIFSGAISPPLGALLLVGLMGFIGLTSRSAALKNIRDAMPETRQARTRAPQITRAAKTAVDRAPRSNLSILQEPYTLLDIGLIIDERRRDGLSLRHARFISLDDESVRPYLVLYYPNEVFQDQVLIRFEISDAAGNPQFIYEMEHRLRAGENLIVPDYRLLLKGNDKLSNTGGWGLSISVDEKVIGVHHFNLLPPVAERLRQGVTDGEVNPAARLMVEEDEDDLPVSLEELLGSQRSTR
jgi:hypothetical protein